MDGLGFGVQGSALRVQGAWLRGVNLWISVQGSFSSEYFVCFVRLAKDHLSCLNAETAFESKVVGSGSWFRAQG